MSKRNFMNKPVKSTKNPQVLAVVTARGGSKGIPQKNIKKLGGIPLVAWTLRVAGKSRRITDLIISTDDPDIATVAKKYRGHVPFMRPKKLALDATPHLPVMQHAIEFMEAKLEKKYDYIVILQPTSPFRTPEDIDDAIDLLVKTGSDSCVSLVQASSHEHPIKIKKLNKSRVSPYCIPEPEGVPRQALPAAFRRSGAVYAMRRDLVMKKGRLFGKKISGYVVPRERSIDIDTLEDWAVAEYMIKHNKLPKKLHML